jgi:hypothetical protein
MWKTGKDMPKSLISEALGFDAHVESTPSALPSISTKTGNQYWSNWPSGNPTCYVFYCSRLTVRVLTPWLGELTSAAPLSSSDQ